MPESITCPVCNHSEEYNPPDDDNPYMYKCENCNLSIYHAEIKEWFVSVSYVMNRANRVEAAYPGMIDKIQEILAKSSN